MESLAGFSVGGRLSHLRLLSPSPPSNSRTVLRRRPGLLRVAASSDEASKLDKWDRMELEFGRLLGEDPKLTLAKIMAKKSNPHVSYMDVEKAYYKKKKGKQDDGLISIPEDLTLEGKSETMFKLGNISLSRPVMNKRTLRSANPGLKPVLDEKPAAGSAENIGEKSEIPRVPLRKPTVFRDDEDVDAQSKLKIKPNLFLKMRKDSDGGQSDVTLLKKPEVIKISSDTNEESGSTCDSIQSNSLGRVRESDGVSLLSPSGILSEGASMDTDAGASDETKWHSVNSSTTEGMRNTVHDDSGNPLNDNGDSLRLSKPDVVTDTVNDYSNAPSLASLLGKPQRLSSPAEEVPESSEQDQVSLNDEDHNYAIDNEQIRSEVEEECEDRDWKRAEDLYNTGERDEVELVSCSSRGFVVSFGSLVGFLPYRNLGAKWKFLAFESWLRRKGLEPSLYRQNLSILGSADGQDKNPESNKIQQMVSKDEEPLQLNMKFQDLLETYNQEKTKFLSSFIGQKIRVSVILADRKARKLMFSGRPKEREELVEKKRSLMAKLTVGDIVKCSIKRITYFGIFVEVDEVTALIPQSEVSWDAALDPSSVFKIGQDPTDIIMLESFIGLAVREIPFLETLDAKVHQLDYGLQRITLSLKEIMPDPLTERLESVVGDAASLEGRLEASQADIEWNDVDALIKELQNIDGIHSASKGRFFFSPGLAPTFQVYMASMFDNQYKLLARDGNKVQEVIVQASINKEEMKAAILTCTNKVG